MFVVLCATALIAGCDEQPKEGASAVTASSASAAVVKDDDLATPADFEDEAEKSISAANYKAEVDALEKEIDAEP